MESSILSEVDDTSILRTGLSTPLSLSSQPATASRLLPPRSGLERSDFVQWHKSEVPERIDDVCSWGQSGRNMLAASLSAFVARSSQVADVPIIERIGPHHCRTTSSPWRLRPS